MFDIASGVEGNQDSGWGIFGQAHDLSANILYLKVFVDILPALVWGSSCTLDQVKRFDVER